MKRLIKQLIASVGISAMTILSITGCRAKSVEINSDIPVIGIVQITEHLSLDTIRESITKELEVLGYSDGETIYIDYQNAQNEQANLSTICNNFVGNEVDAIVAIATPSAQAAANATSDIPIIFSAVTDPLAAQLVTNLQSPEGNVTGTSDAIPVEQVFELCQTLTPTVEKIGFIYTVSEINAVSVIEKGKIAAENLGLEYEEITITNTSELLQAGTILAEKVDAIYVPIDNTIASAMPILAEIGKEQQIPIYVGADSMVIDGGYATIGINYENLGKQTAHMVAKILEGTSITDLPVETLDHYEKLINKATAEAIGAPATLEGAIIIEE